jgi:hypothetical protein
MGFLKFLYLLIFVRKPLLPDIAQKIETESKEQTHELYMRLDMRLYELLADCSKVNGSGGGCEGMAQTALHTACDLFARVGIEHEKFIEKAVEAIFIVDEYNKTKKTPLDDIIIDKAVKKHYKKDK